MEDLRSPRGRVGWTFALLGVLVASVFAASIPARADPPDVSALTPNGGEAYPGGSRVPISWNHSHGNDGSMRTTIRYSVGGGGSYPYFVTSQNFSAGRPTYRWSAPMFNTSSARVRVCSVGSDFERSCLASAGKFSRSRPPRTSRS